MNDATEINQMYLGYKFICFFFIFAKQKIHYILHTLELTSTHCGNVYESNQNWWHELKSCIK